MKSHSGLQKTEAFLVQIESEFTDQLVSANKHLQATGSGAGGRLLWAWVGQGGPGWACPSKPAHASNVQHPF